MTAHDVNADDLAPSEAIMRAQQACRDADKVAYEKGYAAGYRAAHVDLAGEVRGSTGRSAKDYAIEHAGYMARAATGLIAAINDLELARQQFEDGEGNEDATHEAEQSLGDALSAMRDRIYEFEKRRDRALAKLPTKEKP